MVTPAHPKVAPEAVPRSAAGRAVRPPSRSVALTLPLDVIATLEQRDSDLSRAIVQLAAAAGPERAAAREAELSRYGRRAVIVVSPSARCAVSKGSSWCRCRAAAPSISLDRSLTAEAFELRLRDLLDAGVPEPDRAGIRQVVQVLTDARRSERVHLQARTILVLESARRR